MNSRFSRLLLFIPVVTGLCFFTGCANITAPTGGKKDTTPPRLTALEPQDSLLNVKTKRIELNFDEYITLSDAIKEVALSPILSIQPIVTSNNKHVVVKIVDSLLEENTTYRLSFGNAIKDLHEGNAFAGYTYTFSTGAYFDSLELRGSVISAATGLPDSTGVVVVLYSVKDNDSAVVRRKPKYVTKANAKGEFVFKGLPGRSFRIYGLKDPNGNLIYDGALGGEMIAFNEVPVLPGDTAMKPLRLRMFTEMADTAAKNTDSVRKVTDSLAKESGLKKKGRDNSKNDVSYSVNLDTTTVAKRTYDITRPINLSFNRPTELNKTKITISYDSSGVTVTPGISIVTDSLNPLIVHVSPEVQGRMHWREDRVYTLRLAKGFAKDTAGKDLMPARYTFRTWEEEDYGKIPVHLPVKYLNAHYVLMVTTDRDTVYQKPVTDTVVKLSRLRPGRYTIRVIADKNDNGKWDTGDLFAKVQPEEVIPYPEDVKLKAGWENIIDFEQKPKPVMSPKGKALQGK